MTRKKTPYAVTFRYGRKLIPKNQREMAALMGCNQSTISRIERGQIIPRQDLLAKLSELTGEPVDVLVQKSVSAIRAYAPSYTCGLISQVA
ncbi:helix-turn-helix domain-containing protein [Roseivirga sp. BDSF3-8]|uniref:helix-turn-helix domain-containing protein n=1 Tax=Roseivirga sp. BDSF3-8 TaxID=3241598 RepID=UPI0035324D2C